MTRVYLFCNENYGNQFALTSIRWAKRSGCNLTLVPSITGSGEGRKKIIDTFSKLQKKLEWIYRFKWCDIIPVQDVNLDRFISKIESGSLGVISGYNQIFKKKLIDRFDFLVNFHPSVLPYYRGPVPAYWCIKNNESWTGYTLHEVTEKIDSGRILYQEKLSIKDNQDSDSLEQYIANSAQAVFYSFLESWLHGGDWNIREIDADTVYNKKIDYLSFPDTKKSSY